MSYQTTISLLMKNGENVSRNKAANLKVEYDFYSYSFVVSIVSSLSLSYITRTQTIVGLLLSLMILMFMLMLLLSVISQRNLLFALEKTN